MNIECYNGHYSTFAIKSGGAIAPQAPGLTAHVCYHSLTGCSVAMVGFRDFFCMFEVNMIFCRWQNGYALIYLKPVLLYVPRAGGAMFPLRVHCEVFY